jgi:predicted transcriptional regulator
MIKNKTLGQLETKVMEILWDRKKCTVREVVDRLKNKKAYTTIMTVMDRLYNKGILKRQMSGSGAYAYSPAQDKQTFYSQVSKKIISSLIAEFGEAAIAQFVDILESSNKEDLKRWRRRLKKISKL